MKLQTLLALLLTIGLYTSCCTKRDCVAINTLSVTFYGFTREEVDTVYITGYAANSGFSVINTPQQLNNISDDMEPEGVFILNYNDATLYDDRDWEIYIPATGKKYQLTGYTYNSYSCNNCPFRKDDKVRSVNGCNVNGNHQNLPLKINK